MCFAKRAAIVLMLSVLMTGCAKEIQSTITYTAIGTASTLDLGYRDASGELQRVEGYPRPWSLRLTGYRSRQYLELRVRPVSNDGSAVCVIAIDGEEVAIDEAKGLPEEAICSYRLP
jgi:hypothetical protein